MNPLIPHLISECLCDLNIQSEMKWPSYDKKYLEIDDVEIVIQINGKKKSTIKVKNNSDEKTILEKAEKDDKVIKNMQDKVVFKYIYVENRLINLIIK